MPSRMATDFTPTGTRRCSYRECLVVGGWWVPHELAAARTLPRNAPIAAASPMRGDTSLKSYGSEVGAMRRSRPLARVTTSVRHGLLLMEQLDAGGGADSKELRLNRRHGGERPFAETCNQSLSNARAAPSRNIGPASCPARRAGSSLRPSAFYLALSTQYRP